MIQNTHRQLAYWVSTPPSTGPNTPAEASTVPTTAEIYFLASSGVTSGMMIIEMLYKPGGGGVVSRTPFHADSLEPNLPLPPNP